MLDERIQSEQIEDLANAMVLLDSREDMYHFFEDVLTIHELQAISQRLAVARLLQRKVTYQEIAERTGASTATISRVNRCLSYGAGGYSTVLTKLDKLEQENGEAR